MEARRNPGPIVPTMITRATKSKSTNTKMELDTDDIEAQRAILDRLKLDGQTERAFSRNSKGKPEIPRTSCWERFYHQPHHHVLNCRHAVQTMTIVACGTNCATPSYAKHPPQGKTIDCQKCIQKRSAICFIPKRRARLPPMAPKVEKMEIVHDKLFVERDESKDIEIMKEQLELAGYPNKKPQVLFEPAPARNPRKRRAVDEPTCDNHDNTTDELPRPIKPVKGRGGKKGDLVHESGIAGEVEHHCCCRALFDEDMIRCISCKQHFHPGCVGYGELNLPQREQFKAGMKRFFCDSCRIEKAEAEFRHKASRQARKGADIESKPKTVAEMKAEIKGVRGNAKVRRKAAQKKDVMRGKKTKTPAPSLPNPRVKAPPPPPSARRFALTSNKFTRINAAKRAEERDDMKVDDSEEDNIEMDEAEEENIEIGD